MNKLIDLITSPTFWMALTGVLVEVGSYLQTLPLSPEVSHVITGTLFAAVAIRRAMQAPKP